MSKEPIRIRRGEINGALCNQFRDELQTKMQTHPDYPQRKDQTSTPTKQANRPLDLPNGSIFIYAESDDPHNPVILGSMALIILHATSPHYQGLPTQLKEVGEVKRAIVRDDSQRRGVASELLRALEGIAREELGLKYLVVETWCRLEGARRFYERAEFERREPWGGYDGVDSCCYGKWL